MITEIRVRFGRGRYIEVADDGFCEVVREINGDLIVTLYDSLDQAAQHLSGAKDREVRNTLMYLRKFVEDASNPAWGEE